jgi:ABC-type transport system involved in cytochrome c biogenesis permease component
LGHGPSGNVERRLDMNFLPIVERELRVAARRPSTSLVRFLVALAGTILWVGLLGVRQGRASPADTGESLFVALSASLFAWCLCAGVFLTADCLSSEKRDGTLGLLFLTDLRGYDVVLGKLASSSLRSVYGVVAAIPVLALPILLGGVTGEQFWRVVLTLLVTLFLSLACGLFLSAVTRQSRTGMGATFLILFFVAAVLPLSCYAMFDPPLPRHTETVFLLPSPAYLLYAAWGFSPAASASFFGSLAVSVSMALTFLALACVTLPLNWRDRAEKSARGPAKRRQRLRDFSNPYFWLAQRGQASHGLVWGLVFVAALASIALLVDTHRSIAKAGRPGWELAMAVLCAFAAHQLFKYMVASESSRCFSEDRRNGTMELLLVSPLPPAAIIKGQRRALWSLFQMPAWTLVVLNLFLIFAHGLTQPFGPQFETWAIVLVGGVALLVCDYYALSWTGMWLGLRGWRHHRAVMGTLLRIMLPPWVVALLLFLGVGRGRLNFEEMLICWMFLGAVVSLAIGQCAQMELQQHFRAWARTGHDASNPDDEYNRYWILGSDFRVRQFRAKFGIDASR